MILILPTSKEERTCRGAGGGSVRMRSSFVFFLPFLFCLFLGRLVSPSTRLNSEEEFVFTTGDVVREGKFSTFASLTIWMFK